MADAKTYDNVVVTNLEHSEIEITGEIPSEYFTPFRNKAIKKLGDKTKIDGFRSGHIPEKILLERISEQVVLEEAAEMALSQVYPKIVADKKLSVIGYPQITLTKLAKGNPLGYKIKTAVIPEFELPPYTNIAQEVMSKKEIIEVNEKEIDDVILDIRKTRAQSEKKQQTQPNKDTDVNTLVDAQGNPLRTKESEVSDINLPPLNDETVKTFGDFKDIADFRNRLKENMIKEKGLRAKDKKRAELSDALISKTTIDLPNILVESELDKMLGQLKDDISRMNMKYEDYLAHMKKNRRRFTKRMA